MSGYVRPSESIAGFIEKKYTFKYMLGEGSFSKVWVVAYRTVTTEGNDSSNSEILLACKVVDSRNTSKEYRKKFIPREIAVLSRIKHPYLIHMHSIYSRGTSLFIFMRLCEKGDLLEYLLAEEINEKQARIWAYQLALGLQYLHTLGIVHRNIKCENILITEHNNLQLGDFGFSRFIKCTPKEKWCSTNCGSLAYAAPELLTGKPYSGKRCDVWSLGVVLYIMVNQRMPFDDTNVIIMYNCQISNSWRFTNKAEEKLSSSAKELIRLMLNPTIGKRLDINDVIEHEWFKVDEKYSELMPNNKFAHRRNKMRSISEKLPRHFLSPSKRKNELICLASSEISLNESQCLITSGGPSLIRVKDSNSLFRKTEVTISSEDFNKDRTPSESVVQVTYLDEQYEGSNILPENETLQRMNDGNISPSQDDSNGKTSETVGSLASQLTESLISPDDQKEESSVFNAESKENV